MCDFVPMCKSELQVSEDRKLIKEFNDEQVKQYQMSKDKYGIEKHQEIENPVESSQRYTIGTLETNGRLNIESVFPIICTDNKNKINVEFTPQIMRAIEQRKAHAALDAAMNDSKMGGHQMLIDLENRIKMQNTLYHKRWNDNANKGAEAISFLELITVIRKKEKRINKGKITVGIDNRKVHNGVVRTINKAS